MPSNYPPGSPLAMRGQAIYNGLSMGEPNPILASATSAGTIASNLATKTTGLTQPDVPRSLDVVFPALWDGGDITVHGTDVKGVVNSCFYSASAGSTVKGGVIFKTITSLSNSNAGGAGLLSATAELSSLIYLAAFLPTGAFAPVSFDLCLVFWEDLNASSQGWFLSTPDPTKQYLDLSAQGGIPAVQVPNGSTLYQLIQGN